MRIEDLKNWTVDQLKEEVVRLADEREKQNNMKFWTKMRKSMSFRLNWIKCVIIAMS